MGFYSSSALGVSRPTRHQPRRRRRTCIYAVCRETHGRWRPRRATRGYTRARRMICKETRGLELSCQFAIHFLVANRVADCAKIIVGMMGRTSTHPQGTVVGTEQF